MNEFEKQLVNDPFNQNLRIEYADSLSLNGDFENAISQLKIVLKTDPDNAQVQQKLAFLTDDCASNKIDLLPASEAETLQPETAVNNLKEPDKLGASTLSLIQGGQSIDPINVISISSAEKVRFADIAGMVEAKKIIKRRIIDPFANPGLFNKFKKRAGGGVLLYGPPGCGKTMLAKAIATECNATFLSIGISDILSMYKGESESQLASVFERARELRPAILFFDELDALAYSRSKASSDYTRTIVNEFLNQLDGSQTDNEKVLILGATNMPWDVDDAMKRPGRFDRQVFVQPLDLVARAELLKRKMYDIPKEEIHYEGIAKQCEYFSGADMDALIEAAKDSVLDELMNGAADRGVNQEDFNLAIEQITPTTIDWLKTARNLVKYGNAGGTYKDVEKYLRSIKMY